MQQTVHDQNPGNKVDIDNFYAPGALNKKEETPEEEKSEDVEGDEVEDTEEKSEDEGAGDAAEDDEDEGEDISADDDQEFEDDDDEEEDDAEARAKDAEKKRRGFQSENAKLKNQNKKLEARLQKMQEQLENIASGINQRGNQNYQQQVVNPGADEADLSDLKSLLTGDPDDYPTNEKIIKIIDGISKRQDAARKSVQVKQQTAGWIQSQPDYIDVNKYASTNNLANDPYFNGAVTDETGAFFAVRSKLQSEELKKLRSENRQLRKKMKKKGKGRVPVTGARGLNSPTSPKKKDTLADFWTVNGW